MAKKTLIISYYANNKGTTDYLLDYLQSKGSQFYYLKHPLPEMGVSKSTLIAFDGSRQTVVAQYSSSKNFIVKTVIEILVTFWVSLKLRMTKKVKTTVGFGAINAAVVVYLRLLGSRVIFWGVDYSPARFNSGLLDNVYSMFETIACRLSHLTIQPNEKQAHARIERHHLNPAKSLVIPNGITKIDIPLQSSKQSNATRLLYVGSITPAHGVVDFVKYVYGDLHYQHPITLFGDGSDFEKLKTYVKENNLNELVDIKGSCHPDSIKKFVSETPERLVGIAPYDNSGSSHVAFADSLKLKEYVNLGMPFISSNAITVSDELKMFGVVYKQLHDVKEILEKEITKVSFSEEERNVYVNTLDWKYLFSKQENITLL